MTFRIFILISLLVSGCSSGQRPRLAICAIFKNEAPWLKEWLVYHRDILNVDHFYLYNNDSTDNYREIVQPFIDSGHVELFDWSSNDPSHCMNGICMDAPWSAAQLGAYNDCLKRRALGNTDWVAMIDIDEFIVPVKGVFSFYAMLNHAAKHNKGTVCLSWRVFGTSDVQDLQEGDLLIDKLVWRGKDDYPWNHHVKSIHRPEAIVSCAVHIAEKLAPHFGGKLFSADQVRIHHYWTRTENECRKKRELSKDLRPEFFDELHQVEDRIISQYIPLLKRQMEKLDRE